MPVHPSEENAHTAGHESITESVAANPSSNTDSTASEHSIHREQPTNTQAHNATPGPVISKSVEDVKTASKDESRAKAKELNKE
ncbi:MAG: hypothetical protein M1814_002292 [Vezdaea aestivalis]|nr:MAG: hypothetical protein M1814_002292 [Vezdaea aestivalis]